mgnify:FL=1
MRKADSGGRDEDEDEEDDDREVTVEVTEDDIRSARWEKTYDCPVARAVRRALRIDIYASSLLVQVIENANRGGYDVEILRRIAAGTTNSRVIEESKFALPKVGVMFVRNWDCWISTRQDEDDRPVFASGLPEHIQPFRFSMPKPNFLP